MDQRDAGSLDRGGQLGGLVLNVGDGDLYRGEHDLAGPGLVNLDPRLDEGEAVLGGQDRLPVVLLRDVRRLGLARHRERVGEYKRFDIVESLIVGDITL